MEPFASTGMKYDGQTFQILDQTLLPHREYWLDCDKVETLVELIKRLAVRGAPAIGVSAAILLGLLAERGRSPEDLEEDALTLRQARPTAVNLMNNVDRLRRKIKDPEYPQSVVAEAEACYREDVRQSEEIAKLGAELIEPGARILTYCNTGGLATAGSGTAFAVIARAHELKENIFVWVCETRPLLQGGRLTAWECLQHRINHRIICDGSSAMLMKNGEVDCIVVGSDRIARNGDFANKIGTYALAVSARYHNVPFYVAAPCTTIDPDCQDGTAIPVEERAGREVKGAGFIDGFRYWAPEDSEAFNPAFDVTPADLVSGWILDSGVYYPGDIGIGNWWEGLAQE